MTNMEYVKHLLEEAKQRHGENAALIDQATIGIGKGGVPFEAR